MNNKSASIKVGFLTILALAVLISTVIWLRGRGLGGGQSFDVWFKDVDGLREGASVQLMGIRVGFIDKVEPTVVDGKNYRVLVRFTVNDENVTVPKGSILSLQQSGFIGEKFIEITPPQINQATMFFPNPVKVFQANLPIWVQYDEGLQQVGHVHEVTQTPVPRLIKKTPDYQYDFTFIVDKPGYLPPNKPEFSLESGKNGPYLVLNDPLVRWAPKPDKGLYFTLEEPLRLKDFLEEQLASAQALKTTNQKINTLLSDDTIATIQGTLRNSERLTAEAADVLTQAKSLFASTAGDLKKLVLSTQRLTDSVVSVSENVNEVAGDPEVQSNIKKTVRSVEQSTQALAVLLNDPDLKAIMSQTKVTSENAAELTQYLKKATVDGDLQGRINHSITLLDSALTKLSALLENLESASEDKEAIKGIVQNTKETSANLKKFSNRLNKHFLLFRLLF